MKERIIDNFLPQEEFESLQEAIVFNSKFPFHFAQVTKSSSSEKDTKSIDSLSPNDIRKSNERGVTSPSKINP